MNFIETCTLNGYLTVEKMFSDGTTEVVFDENKNLIVNAPKLKLLEWLVTAGMVSDPISTFKIGTGGTYDPAGQYPKTLTGTEIDLFLPLYGSNNMVHTLTPTPPSLQFVFDVLDSEANGSEISEVGLFMASGMMFNIKTFPAIPKNSAFSLRFTWTIKYG